MDVEINLKMDGGMYGPRVVFLEMLENGTGVELGTEVEVVGITEN